MGRKSEKEREKEREFFFSFSYVADHFFSLNFKTKKNKKTHREYNNNFFLDSVQFCIALFSFLFTKYLINSRKKRRVSVKDAPPETLDTVQAVPSPRRRRRPFLAVDDKARPRVKPLGDLVHRQRVHEQPVALPLAGQNPRPRQQGRPDAAPPARGGDADVGEVGRGLASPQQHLAFDRPGRDEVERSQDGHIAGREEQFLLFLLSVGCGREIGRRQERDERRGPLSRQRRLRSSSSSLARRPGCFKLHGLPPSDQGVEFFAGLDRLVDLHFFELFFLVSGVRGGGE